MANLIITIIAIALTAILAIAGAWYGSTAFTEAQAKAEANKILNNFKQAEAAIKLFAVENGGSLPDPWTNWPVSSGSSSTFSASQMASFLEPVHAQSGFFSRTGVTIYRFSGLLNGVLIVRDTSYSLLTSTVCRSIEEMRVGTRPTTLFAYSAADLNRAYCGMVGCFAANGAWGASSFVAYYRLNGKPVGTADCIKDR